MSTPVAPSTSQKRKACDNFDLPQMTASPVSSKKRKEGVELVLAKKIEVLKRIDAILNLNNYNHFMRKTIY